MRLDLGVEVRLRALRSKNAAPKTHGDPQPSGVGVIMLPMAATIRLAS
jgi:hypothetical protein